MSLISIQWFLMIMILLCDILLRATRSTNAMGGGIERQCNSMPWTRCVHIRHAWQSIIAHILHMHYLLLLLREKRWNSNLSSLKWNVVWLIQQVHHETWTDWTRTCNNIIQHGRQEKYMWINISSNLVSRNEYFPPYRIHPPFIISGRSLSHKI